MEQDHCELSLCEVHIPISTGRIFPRLNIDNMKNMFYIWLNASQRS